MQTQQNQKEGAFTSIKKTLGLVSSEGKEGDKNEQMEEHDHDEESDMDSHEEMMNEMDPITMLESQHREVEGLFAELEGVGEKAYKTKERIFKMIMEKLEMHTDIEERIFYKAAREASEDLVLESYEEHTAVKNMLKRLANTEGSDETFDAKIKVLKEFVNHHVEEEENELFPKCRETFDEEELMDLGQAMMARMEKLEDQSKGKSKSKSKGKTQAKRTSQTKAKAKKKTTGRKRTTRGKKRAA